MGYIIFRAAALTLILVGATLAGRVLGPQQEFEGQLGGISITSWIVGLAVSLFMISPRIQGLHGTLLGMVSAGAIGWAFLPASIPAWVFTIGLFFLVAGIAARIFSPE
ncbi:hypothetical protein JFT64_18830 [Pseudomonas carnis]|jgi:hypothetical protein|uniref:hypothetical protein n=1 Tax=Pseudomonas carnis TaxID=2487355 RepID=UPI0018E83310|nr:hypothetical protein [Pseudomonas carnis]MBJ2214101.1 hypothetical protein [Pseudomonas carnis]